MGNLRPARTCRDWQRPWTRTAKRVVRKSFVRGVPDSKINKFDMGTPQKIDDYEIQVDVVSTERVQVRHNSLDACRMAVNRHLEAKILLENYWFKIRVYPHQVLREHSMLSGAGADRLSQGMKHAFGRPSGRAARVDKGQKVMTVYTFKRFEKDARIALKKAVSRLPGTPKITVSKLTEQDKTEAKKGPVKKSKVKSNKVPKKEVKKTKAEKKEVKKEQPKTQEPKQSKPVEKKEEKQKSDKKEAKKE